MNANVRVCPSCGVNTRPGSPCIACGRDEAFASQSLAVVRELGLDEEKVNVNGGAIALGHPLGMSGARLVVSLLHELRRRDGRYGLATLCVGVGQGVAALFERP